MTFALNWCLINKTEAQSSVKSFMSGAALRNRFRAADGPGSVSSSSSGSRRCLVPVCRSWSGFPARCQSRAPGRPTRRCPTLRCWSLRDCLRRRQEDTCCSSKASLSNWDRAINLETVNIPQRIWQFSFFLVISALHLLLPPFISSFSFYISQFLHSCFIMQMNGGAQEPEVGNANSVSG